MFPDVARQPPSERYRRPRREKGLCLPEPPVRLRQADWPGPPGFHLCRPDGHPIRCSGPGVARPQQPWAPFPEPVTRSQHFLGRSREVTCGPFLGPRRAGRVRFRLGPRRRRETMKRSKVSEAQIAFVLKQAEDGTPVGEVCRKARISEAACFAPGARSTPD